LRAARRAHDERFPRARGWYAGGVVSLVAPRSSLLLITAALALGCAVGDGGNGFSSGPALTFGGDASAEGGPGSASGDGSDESDDAATSAGTADGGSADGNDDTPADTADGCTPSPELCNGLDDDCDGTADNDDPEGGDACETGSPGVCAAGTTTCEAGMLACAPTTPASAEVCNGFDDDCDGMPDNGNPGGGGACNTGQPGVCADGTLTCNAGMMDCTPVTAPQAETCNNVDDDCNGQIDNGNPGGGGACNTGLPGICGPGTQQCSAGALSCQQNQGAAGDELCGNGLDDDCNGAAEDGCNTCAHDICLTGVALAAGCDPCVAQVCAVDSFCCNTSWDGICVGEVTSVCGIAC
jgi:hypothetical protein